MTAVGEGYVNSDHYDGAKAAEQLVQDAFDDAGVEEADFAFLFCSTAFKLRPFIDELDSRLGRRCSDWIGCTTAGEISKRGPTEGGAVLLLIEGDEIDVTAASVTGVFDQPEQTGSTAIERLKEAGFPDRDRDNVVAAYMAGLSQKHEGKEFEVLQGIADVIGTAVPVVGGAAGDDLTMSGTYQFHGGEIYTDAVVVAGLSTDLNIHIGQEHGLTDEIASGVVSETDGREIVQISGRPAAQFYADATGTDLEELQQFYQMPLPETIAKGLRHIYLKLTGQHPVQFQRILQYSLEYSLAEEISPDNYRIITPLLVTEQDGLFMTTSVEENSPIHIVTGERRDIIHAGKEAFSHIDLEDEETVFSIVTDCSNRDQLLDINERGREIRAVRTTLQCPVAGFYGYGEIGGTDESFCTFKNQTITGFVITQQRTEAKDVD